MTALRFERLNEWLDQHDARLMWRVPVRQVGTMTCYAVGRAVALVLAYDGLGVDGADGWDLFVPASVDDSAIQTTLDAAERVLTGEPSCKR